MGVSITQMDYPYQTVNLASKTAGAGWDADSDELSIPASTAFVAVSADEPFYLSFNNSTADPAVDGVLYYGEQVYRIPCFEQYLMHYKRGGSSDATITVTAFVASKN
jgi:hypothetical protein